MKSLLRYAGTAVVAAAVLTSSVALGQEAQSRIAYASVAEALQALRAKQGVVFASDGGWTLAKDTDGANWSFTPQNHYAHPSVGRRMLQEHNGQFYVRTQILCQAQKAACDRLVEDYNLLDRRMNEAIRSGK
jgi:hypothetical protein